MQGELAVAAALHLQGGDNVQGGGPQHLVFLVGKGDGRGHHNAVASMDSHRVEVLHGADGDGISGAVTNHLELDFLPARDALFHQNLMDGGTMQAVLTDFPQFLLIGSNAAPSASQCKGGAHNDRIPNLLGKFQG